MRLTELRESILGTAILIFWLMVQDKIIREIKALGSTDHVNEEYISLMAGVLNEDSLKELLAYYQSTLSSTSARVYDYSGCIQSCQELKQVQKTAS